MNVEFENIRPDIEITADMERFKRYRILRSERLKPGHRLFSLDLRSGEIDVVKVENRVAMDYNSKKPVKRNSVVVDDSHLYASALNKKNAERRFEQVLKEIRSVAGYIRENPLLDIRNFKHWDILSAMGFKPFFSDTTTACGLLYDTKITICDENKVERISVCSIKPKMGGIPERVVYDVDMIDKQFVLFPTICEERHIAELVQLAVKEFYRQMNLAKTVDTECINEFNRKYAWLIKLSDLGNFRDTLKRVEEEERNGHNDTGQREGNG